MKKLDPTIPSELVRPSEEFLQASARLGLNWWHWNNLEKKLYLSEGVLEILGYDPKEYDPSVPSIYKNVHPDDVAHNNERIKRLIYGEDKLYETEFRVKNQQGEWQWFYNRGAVVAWDENGKGTIVGGITIDMAEKYRQLMSDLDRDKALRKETEAALKESELIYRTLFEAADDGIALFTSNQDLILFNSAFSGLFGYTNEEFKELGWMEVVHPEDKNVLESVNMEAFSSGSFAADYRGIYKSGEVKFLSSKNVIIPSAENEPLMILSIVRDISERKLAMQELTDAKLRAEESDKLKSAFLANMSHEIRTPMNSIVGFSNLLDNPILDEAARSMYVQRITRNSEVLLALISDIIDLAKIESNQLSLVYGRQELGVLLNEMKQYATDEAERMHKADLVIELVPHEGSCEIETDVIRLTQVLKNLINNAIKFTESGIIRIGCREAEGGKSMIFSVEDSGVGIAEDDFELVFDQFRQVDGSNTRKYSGTGLGLAICRNLVELMGGRIWVESRMGEGSLFQVRLPRKSAAARSVKGISGHTPEIEANNIPSLQILVVDDEPDSLELFTEILKGMGHEVLQAGTGYEALAMLDKESPDIVFMDDQMPVMSGTETLKIIRTRFDDLKVVVQSAHALVGDKARFLKEGFDGYLSKPFSGEQLKELLWKLSSTAPNT